MKKIAVIFLCIFALTDAFAAACRATGETSGSVCKYGGIVKFSDPYCTKWSTYFNNYYSSSGSGFCGTMGCAQCSGTGYYPVSQDVMISDKGCTIAASKCTKICPDECPSRENWTKQFGKNYEARCDYDKCGDWRCVDGYYKSNMASMDEPIICVECPDGGTCKDNKVTCNAGHYRTGSALMGYKCPACPYWFDLAGIPHNGTSPEGATSITQCYEPKGTHMTGTPVTVPGQGIKVEKIGKYEILEDESCFYVEEE